MMHTKRSRSFFGRPNRGLLYLAAAGALYAWRARRQGGSEADRATVDRASRPEADADAASPSGSGAGLEPGRNVGGAGISDLPPDAEAAQQESLPPRGERKPGYHA